MGIPPEEIIPLAGQPRNRYWRDGIIPLYLRSIHIPWFFYYPMNNIWIFQQKIAWICWLLLYQLISTPNLKISLKIIISPSLIHINPYESQLFIVNPLTALVNFDPPPDLGSATGAGAATAGISGRDARRDGTVDGGNGDGNGGEGGWHFLEDRVLRQIQQVHRIYFHQFYWWSLVFHDLRMIFHPVASEWYWMMVAFCG